MDVAIVGMSGIFPGAGSAGVFWQNIVNKVDAIRLVPENRIDRVFFPDTGAAAGDQLSGVDRFYCRRGGFIDEYAEFDPVRFGILPVTVESTEPEQLLALSLAHRALEDAGVFERRLALDRTGIIIGKGNYPGPGTVRGTEIVRTGEEVIRILRHVLPDLSAGELERVKKEFQTKKGRFGADTAMGVIPNLAASLVANRLDLGGAAYTIDAACASSLIAVDHAVRELQAGRCDMMIAGGVHAGQNAPFWSIFTQLGALSRRQRISPFDRRADGLLIGEGCGFVVLKRLQDAIGDEHPVYAVIKGTGVASDGAGTSVMSPSVKGQTQAIRLAWKSVGTDPAAIGYIEAHGTATPLGDKTELETLAQVFGPPSRKAPVKAGIGSVKSMIGHAMPAAGIAGLIKTALALYHGKLPPTLHCEEPLPAMQQTRFEPVRETTDWDETGLPRRAGVNAFGFGGINAHVVLEAFNPRRRRTGRMPEWAKTPGKSVEKWDPVWVLARPDRESLIRALEEQATHAVLPEAGDGPAGGGGRGDHRIVLFNPTPERIKRAVSIVRKGIHWPGRQDMWYSNRSLIGKGGRIAFLFPGLDGLSGGETGSVARCFDLPELPVRKSFGKDELMREAFEATEKSRILDTALKHLGVYPDLNAGHSLGEWLACRSAGLVTEESVLRLMEQVRPGAFEQKDASFLAVGYGYDKLAPLLEDMADVYLSNDNCPQQVILCGTNTALEKVTAVLRKKQILHQRLPFQSGFHSPFVKDQLDIVLEGMNQLEIGNPQMPVWSATTLEPYPLDEPSIRELNVEHLLKPVRFRELTEKLYDGEGVRMFIQIGPGGLPGFIDSTLKGRAYSVVSASAAARPGAEQLRRVLAALFTEGWEGGLSFLQAPALRTMQAPVPETGRVGTPGTAGAARPGSAGSSGSVVKLQLGSPMVGELTSLQARYAASSYGPASGGVADGTTAGSAPEPAALYAPASGMADSPVLKAFMDTCAEINGMQKEVVALFDSLRGAPGGGHDPGRNGRSATGGTMVNGQHGPSAQNPGRISKQLDISLDEHPYLMDHSLVKQKPGWPWVENMNPVIPMTMLLEIFCEIAREQAPGKVVRKIEYINIYQWMQVATPFRKTVTGEWKGADRIFLKLEGHANAEVVLSERYDNPGDPGGETAQRDLGKPLGIDLSPEEIYRRYMFHGPAYQGIRSVRAFENGITGVIRGREGKGSLLDNAGQLFGLWLQLVLPENNIAFPVKIGSVAFYGDLPDREKSPFECACRLRSMNEEFAAADFELKKNGQTLVAVSGWQDRRLGMDQRLWNMTMDPAAHFMSEEIAPGVFLFRDVYPRMASWDFITRCYFNQAEMEHYHSLPLKKRKEWAVSRIAAKDAVRACLLRSAGSSCFPVELEIRSEASGRPFPHGSMTGGIGLSLAHKRTHAVALAREDGPVGVDIEEIRERSRDFAGLVFYPDEQALMKEDGLPSGDSAEDEWLTRAWVAKEAYGKYLGKGLQGNPKAYRIQAVNGEDFTVSETEAPGRPVTVKTVKYDHYIIGWTIH